MILAVDFTTYGWTTALKVGVVLGLIPAGAIILGYVFLLKMMSFMQSRLGPMEAGPYGTLQLVASGGKFIQKEDLIPDGADRTVFGWAPPGFHPLSFHPRIVDGSDPTRRPMFLKSIPRSFRRRAA